MLNEQSAGELVEIRGNGLWQTFEADWRAQCLVFGEDLDNYALGHMKMLKDLADNTQDRAAVFALRHHEDGHFAAACQLNLASLPGYDGPVLRLRFLTLGPRYDLGDINPDDYPRLLGTLLSEVLRISDSLMPARFVKFHLASPGDRTFFSALEEPLRRMGDFETVRMAGTWLYVTKTKSVG